MDWIVLIEAIMPSILGMAKVVVAAIQAGVVANTHKDELAAHAQNIVTKVNQAQ